MKINNCIQLPSEPKRIVRVDFLLDAIESALMTDSKEQFNTNITKYYLTREEARLTIKISPKIE